MARSPETDEPVILPKAGMAGDMDGSGRRRRGREVVVTGAGVLCHMGDDLPALEGMLREGRGTPFQPYPPAVDMNGRCQIAGIYPGELTDEDIGVSKAQGRFMGRQSRLALAAARRALAQAGLTRRDFAVVVGSGAGDVRTHVEIQDRLSESRNMRRILPTVVPRLMASTASANLVNVLGSTGPSFTTSAACAGGAYNLLLAAMLIESGHCDVAVAGGCEETDPHFHSGFDSMRAYNSEDNDHPERASRPYAADRKGFIFAEGAGVVVLESRAAAEARGAGILGVVRGWGMSSDGEGDMVAPSSDGARRSIEAALAHAGLPPDAIDYVNTHGTSTPAGDVSEVRAIRSVLGGVTSPTRPPRATPGTRCRRPGRSKRFSRWRCCAAAGWRRRSTRGRSTRSWKPTRPCSSPPRVRSVTRSRIRSGSAAPT